jgi:hypothetical protein
MVLAVLWACDGQNLFSPSPGLLEGVPPTVDIQTPDDSTGFGIGSDVRVEARITDDAGVDSVVFAGVSFRGDPVLGTDTIVPRYVPKVVRFDQPVTDTVLIRILEPTADSVRDDATIYTIAYDAGGNVGADSVALRLGAPRIEFRSFSDGDQLGARPSIEVWAFDSEGVAELTVNVVGTVGGTEVSEEYSVIPALPLPDSVKIDTVLVTPEGASGTVQVSATAKNGLLIEADAGPLNLTLAPTEAGDDVAPRVSFTSSSSPRLELDDPITVNVVGVDNTQGSGVIRTGFTVKAISPRRSDTTWYADTVAYDQARSGTQSETFTFLPPMGQQFVDSLNLPDTILYEFTGWTYDGEGNCSAAIMGDTLMSLPCAQGPQGTTVASGLTGMRVSRTMVAGRTIMLPTSGRIMDAAVDTLRRKLFLSNIERNVVEVFDLVNEEFSPQAIGVGSEPWGMTLDLSGDTLLVANSGGTNISVVDAELEREIEQNRFFAPDAIIFDLELQIGDAGAQFKLYPFPQPASPSFSDRPQYVAVDSFGSIIYTTKTTPVGDIGTARKAYFPQAADRSEVKLFVEHSDGTPVDDFWAFAHVDSIHVGQVPVGQDQEGNAIYAAGVTVFDHVPGFPNQTILGSSNTLERNPVENAAGDLVAQGSDVHVISGARWDIPEFGFADTTFVTASGDHGWVLIGEGGTSPLGRVMMYKAAPGDATDVSTILRVWDDLINAADRVSGVGLNYDGTLGVARGQSAYFFDSELQLNGRIELPGAGTGTGAALHPLHANQRTLENYDGEYRPDSHIAFVGTSDGTVDIIDTFKFTRIGQITLKDVITGPLRATLPFDDDNVGLQCPRISVLDQVGNSIGATVQLYQNGDFNQPISPTGAVDESCVVVNLYAITSGGGVVVVPVRKSDILKYHPNRIGS